MKQDKKLIIINYNGPMVDSFENTMNLTRYEFPGITEQEVRNFYDKNIFTAIKEYGEIAVSEEQLKIYFKNVHNPAQNALGLVQGMKSFFDEIFSYADFAINSSGDKKLIEKALKRFSLADYFVNILDKYDSQDKQAKFKQILDAHGKQAGDVFYITDKIGDMKEAQQAGLKVILVTWGYQKKEHLEKKAQNVFKIVDTPKELKEVLREAFTKS